MCKGQAVSLNLSPNNHSAKKSNPQYRNDNDKNVYTKNQTKKFQRTQQM